MPLTNVNRSFEIFDLCRPSFRARLLRPGNPWSANDVARIRIVKHEAVPGCGSFEVRFPDGRESVYFYWDDLPSRRLRPETLDRETALEKAEAVARAA
jgi:hypothetical protein